MGTNKQKSRGTAQEAGMHRDSITRGLFSGLLWKMAQKLPPAERVIEQKRQGRPAVKNDLSDQQIAEARRAYEAGEKKCKELAGLYGVPRSRMWQILQYQTRSARTDVRQPA